jgi:transposase
MFLKKTYSKNHTYLSLVETYRQQNKVKHRVIAQLGRQDELIANKQLFRIIESLSKVAGVSERLGLESMEEKERLNWGGVKVYRYLWDLFKMDDVLEQSIKKSRSKVDFKNSTFLMALCCLVKPSSKLKVFKGQNRFLGLEEIPLHELYRTLDLLCDGKQHIEEVLFEKNVSLFNMEIDIVFYDVTTLYFESVRGDNLRDFGFSKDNKINEVQVVVGLLVDTEGRPIGIDVFSGNTFEGHTLEKALTKLKKRFKIREVVVVADRGINAKLNLKAIRDCGFDYIVGSRLKSMPKAIRSKVLDMQNYVEIPTRDEKLTLKSFTMNHDNWVIEKDSKTGKKTKTCLKEILACTWSSKRAEKDRKDRQRAIKKAEGLIQDPNTIYNKRGARKYIEIQQDSNPTLNQQKIDDDEKWDGFYGIQCSRLEMAPQKIAEAYHRLWKIEESFRVLKSTLQTRPIFHWTPKRIKGHLMVCFIAFLLERTLELELKKKNISFSPDTIREALNQLEMSVIDLNGQTLLLRSKVTGLGAQILRSLKLATPKNLSTQPATT